MLTDHPNFLTTEKSMKFALTMLVERQEGHPACEKPWRVLGVGVPLFWLGWRPPGLSVPLHPLSSRAP